MRFRSRNPYHRMAAAGSLLFVVLVSACAPYPYTRLNSPPQGDAEQRPEWADYYTYHNDQGMLADMSISDIHFVPHTTALSGTGEARLERYAELLATRDGTIAYDTMQTDPELIEKRMDTAQAFLAQALPGKRKFNVEMGPPGGRGMTSREAIPGDLVARQPEPRANAYYLSISRNLERED